MTVLTVTQTLGDKLIDLLELIKNSQAEERLIDLQHRTSTCD